MFEGGAARTELDDRQRAAVAHRGAALVIAAGAGTGKTQTMTARVASLLQDGVPAERILLLTFTRRAASAMSARAAALCGDPRAAARLWTGTFHAIGHRLVSEHAEHLGLSGVNVLDPEDVATMFDLLREDHGLTGTRTRLPSGAALAEIHSKVVNTGHPAREVIKADFPWVAHLTEEVLPVLQSYGPRKRAAGVLDFDDLLLCWAALLSDPGVGARLRARWDHVLVDEYQDVNAIQEQIALDLRPDGTGLTVVGDEAQAIYGFRGASGAHLSGVAERFPDASLVRLERNFRSVQPILDIANAVRPGDATRLTLTASRCEDRSRPVILDCRDADTQARLVAEAVLAAREDGVALRDQAVLMRAGSHSRELEIELTVRNIPFTKYGGIGYLQTAHVRDLLAVFRVVLNTRDELAWHRLLCLHTRIGRATASTLLPLLTTEHADAEIVASAPAPARTALARTLHLISSARASRKPAACAAACMDAVRPLIRSRYPDWPARMEDTERLAEAAASRYELSAFITDLTLDPASASADYAGEPRKDDDWLVLTTVHSAKGLEWDRVHLIHATDGAFPSDMALGDEGGLAEEQRLFYVAVTRARDYLYIYTPQRLPVSGSLHTRHVLGKASRFLTAEVRLLLDTWTPPIDPSETPAAPPHPVAIPTLADLFV